MLVLLESFQPLSVINVSASFSRGWVRCHQGCKDEQDITAVLDLGEGMRNVTKPAIPQHMARAIGEVGVV